MEDREADVSWLVWCKKCKTEAIEVHPDNVESESSVCWDCYPYYHLDQVAVWRGPYHVPEYFAPKPDPAERTYISLSELFDGLEKVWETRDPGWAAAIGRQEYNTVDPRQLRADRVRISGHNQF